MPLRENVKAERERIGFTQIQLGKMAGVSQATISKLESGESTDISYKTLFQVADALGLDARAGRRVGDWIYEATLIS